MPDHFTKRFQELYGDSEGEVFIAPTLSDVAPALIQTPINSTASKELNPRRFAVSARPFRSSRIRSAEQPVINSDGFTLSPQRGRLVSRGSSYIEGSLPGEVQGFGDPALQGTDIVGEAIGDTAASHLGTIAKLGGLSTLATGIAMKAPPEAIAQAVPATAISTALGPFSVANTIAGAVYAGEASEEAVGPESNIAAYGLTPAQVSQAQADAATSVFPISGFLGQMGRLIGSYIMPKSIRSPQMIADESATQSAATSRVGNIASQIAAAETAAEYGTSAVPGMGLVGPEDTAEDISEAFGVAESTSLPPVGPTQGLGMAPASPSTATGKVSGLIQSGLVAPQGASGTASISGLGSTGMGAGSAPTGRGDIGAGGGAGK